MPDALSLPRQAPVPVSRSPTRPAAHGASGPEPAGRSRFWLSVLVPAYKVEAYLDQCLGSIIGQADAGVEIVVCDDASPDGSGAIARAYAERYPHQVRLIVQPENRGIAATRNSLLDAATGDYVWFVDSDDWLRAGAIAAVARTVSRHAPDLIGCDYRKGRIRKFAFAGPYGRLLTDRDQIVSGICGSRKMYVWVRIARRALWAGTPRFPEGRVFEDAAVMPWLALEARSYVHIGRALVHYRVRAHSIMHGIRHTSGAFDMARHLDLARALRGYTDRLDAESEPFSQTRLAASHFIAMEFAKIAARIRRAGPQGTDADSARDLIGRFRAIMEPTSPIPFARLRARYWASGRWAAWWQLRRAMAMSA